MPNEDYRMHIQVQSNHCDSTGIVQHPRYAEMAQTVVENWFDEALDWSFARMVGRENAGVPVVRSQSDYPAASRLGDQLLWRLEVQKIGRSSVDILMRAQCGPDQRVSMSQTLVHSDTGALRPRAWPAAVRARMEDFQSGEMAAQ